MRAIELLPERVRVHAKAIAAMVVPAVSLLLTLRVNGDVTWVEWVSVAGIALAAGGFVDMVPNRLTVEQVERFYDQLQDKYGGTLEFHESDLPGSMQNQDEPPDDSGKHRRE